jgi:hypothetical protein
MDTQLIFVSAVLMNEHAADTAKLTKMPDRGWKVSGFAA